MSASGTGPRRRTAIVVAVGLAAAALVGVVVAIVLVATRSSAPKALPAPATVTLTQPQVTVSVATPATPAASAITAAQMRQMLQRYVNAYSNESVSDLRALFADNLVRTNGSDPSEDLNQALVTYSSQFASLTNPSYSITNISYDPGQATATGEYSITSQSSTATGQILFHFVTDGNRLLIDQLFIEPS